MDVGIGLPNTVPKTTGDELTEWARRAEDAGFSTLGTIDRVAYPNLEPMVALAAASAVTERIRLATTILIAPFRQSAAVIAKQAASIQRISDGRMVLGVAVGGRRDDYEAAGADFEGRGETFERQLAEIRRTWGESSASSGAAEHTGVGPDVADSPPQLIVGGSIDAAFRRAAEFGDGWIMGGGAPEMFAEGREKAERAWREAGREGRPRTMALAYFSLGDDAEANADAYLRDYYAFLGEYADQIAASAAKDADTVRAYVKGFEDVGCDELVLFPSSSDPEQVDLLAEAALHAEAAV
jgi:alkanesulfonate monooxygenase SsuD/methylene tetrahydromethanopterin reductase-like flavin-dependent oxidoreductase (luciferase family)